MQNAIILHGKANQTKYYDPAFDSPSNASWLPWLQKQLLMRDILAQTPEMPLPWKPEYSAWSKELERFSITPETILVAHSCGAGFLVRWLSEHSDVRVGKVVLVAPWIDPDRTGGTGEFFDFTFDSRLPERTAQTTIFVSKDDFDGVHISTKMIREAIPGVGYREFDTYGHFTQVTEFLELRDELLTTE
jgi:predicted alpha/beta hydrolase family esterase